MRTRKINYLAVYHGKKDSLGRSEGANAVLVKFFSAKPIRNNIDLNARLLVELLHCTIVKSLHCIGIQDPADT